MRKWNEHRAFLITWAIFAAGTLAALAWTIEAALRPLGKLP